MADRARVKAFHQAIWELNEPEIRALLAQDPNLIYKRLDFDDCMATLFKSYFKSQYYPESAKPIEEIFRIMDVLFELGYKPTLNRLFTVSSRWGEIHVGIKNLFFSILQQRFTENIRQLLKKLLEHMSDEELNYLNSFRFPIRVLDRENDIRNNKIMDEISKIIVDIQKKYKERYENTSHLSNLFSSANRGHLRAAAEEEGGAVGGAGAAAPRLPPRSKLGKAPGDVRNLIGSFLSGETGTINNQLSSLRPKLLSSSEPALAAGGAGAPAPAAAKAAALLPRPGPPNSQLINYHSRNENENENNNNNNQNGGRRRVSRKSRQRKSKTMRHRK